MGARGQSVGAGAESDDDHPPATADVGRLDRWHPSFGVPARQGRRRPGPGRRRWPRRHLLLRVVGRRGLGPGRPGDVVGGCMPALGHTVVEPTIAYEFEKLDLADFCRAYLNWWPGEIPADWQVVAEADWLALADPSSAAVDPVAFAADVTPDRSAAAIAVAGVRPDGLG